MAEGWRIKMLSWKKEPMFRPVPVDTLGDAGSERDELLFDAYSQWKLGHGLAYDRDIQARVGTIDDITLLRKLSLDDGGILGTASAEMVHKAHPEKLQRTPSQPRATATPPKNSNGRAETDGYDDIWVPLPIRTSGVAEKLYGGKPPKYLAPKKLDRSKTVVIGIIDDAVNVAHENFDDENGITRFDYLWVQDADTSPLATDGSATSFVAYGREVDRAKIEQARAKHGTNEEAIWRHLHMVSSGDDYRRNALQMRRAHGTHIADLAAGNGEPDGGTVNQRVVGVQMPVLATQDTSGASLIAVVADAARYIYQRALRISEALNTPVPVVLNLSYGISVGARDGRHLLDRLLQKYAAEYRDATVKLDSNTGAAPAIAVLPAGNGHLARGNARSESGSLDLRLQVQPQDETASYVEIWFSGDASSIKLNIAPPGMKPQRITFKNLRPDHPTSMVRRDAWVLAEEEGGPAVCRVTLDEPSEFLQQDSGRLHWRVLIAFGPSVSLQNRPTVPPGEWVIQATGETVCKTISAWIARDENLSGFPSLGRQSYFLDDKYETALFDRLGDMAVDETPDPSPVDRNMTISGIGHANSDQPDANSLTTPVLVGGNFWDNRHAAPYSAAGGSSAGGRAVNGPVISAPSDSSRAMPGLLAAGNRSGSVVVQNGTSVAVPQVVRWLADTLTEMSATQRAMFDANQHLLATFGPRNQQAPRPSQRRPEMTSEPQIRIERLQGGFLNPAAASGGVERGVSRKI